MPAQPGRGEAGRQAGRFEMASHALALRRRDEPEPSGEIEGQHHAQRHRLAMQEPAAEPGFRLQSVPEGVTEIQQRAVTLLPLVDGDDRRLHPAAGHHRVPDRVRLQSAQRIALAFAPSEEFSIADQAVFDDLGVAGKQLAPRQGRQRVGVGKNQARLVEGADQVLADPGVDPGLAADRAVDLGQQGRRDLHEVDAAQQRRRGKSGHVANDAAAQRHQHRTALDAAGQDLLGQAAEMVEIFGFFARRQHNGVMRDPGVGEAVAQRRQVMPGDSLVGDDHRLTAAHQGQDLTPGLLDQSWPDNNVIGALAQFDAQPLGRSLGGHRHPSLFASGGVIAHGQAASAAIARLTVASGEPSPLSTVTSASA